MINISEVEKRIYAKYIEPTKNKREKFVGVEIELPIVNLNKEAVDFELIYEITDKFLDTFGFEAIGIDDNGHIYAAQNKENGDILSYDCSYNNMEFSFGKCRTVHQVNDRFTAYYEFMNILLGEHNYTLTGMGVNPYRIYNRQEPIPNERYRMLFRHINSYTEYDIPMYFHDYPSYGLFSSASQVQLDVDYDDIVDVINVFSKLEPVKAILFSNSVLLGEDESLACARDMLWENSTHGINSHNVGMFQQNLGSVEELVNYIKSTSIYCVMRDGKYINFKPINIMEYFQKDSITGEYYNGEEYESITFEPELDDLDYLRTFKFEDLTFRGTVEFRSVCCQPIADAMSVAAFHLGLLIKLDEVGELLSKDKTLYQKGYNATELRKIFNSSTWPANFDKEDVYKQVRRVLDIARAGLESRGYGEEEYLDSLYDRVDKKTNPGIDLIKSVGKGKNIEDIIKSYA